MSVDHGVKETMIVVVQKAFSWEFVPQSNISGEDVQLSIKVTQKEYR